MGTSSIDRISIVAVSKIMLIAATAAILLFPLTKYFHIQILFERWPQATFKIICSSDISVAMAENELIIENSQFYTKKIQLFSQILSHFQVEFFFFFVDQLAWKFPCNIQRKILQSFFIPWYFFKKHMAQNHFTSRLNIMRQMFDYIDTLLYIVRKVATSCNTCFMAKRKPLKCATNEYNIIYYIRLYVFEYVWTFKIFIRFCGVFFMVAVKRNLSESSKNDDDDDDDKSNNVKKIYGPIFFCSFVCVCVECTEKLR